MKKYYIILSLLFFLIVHCFSQNNLSWKEETPGVWKTKIGKPDNINFYTILNQKPKTEELKSLPSAIFPLNNNDIIAEIIDGKTYLHFPLEEHEKIYGLGLNFKTVEQRGRIMRLHVDHYGGVDNGRTHAPVPFYVSSKGYGILINSARYIDIWVGTTVRKDSKHPPAIRDRNTDKDWAANPYSDNIEILIPAEGTEIFIFAGPTMLDAIRRYNLFSGGGCLPPKWGLGFWHRTPTLYSDKDVIEEVNQYAKHKFPLSVIGLEPGWQSRSYPCTYEWDKDRFPNPEQFIENMKQRGIYINLWMNPYISPESEICKSILPYTASHTVWTGIIPDYSMPEAQKIIGGHFEKHLLNKGVSGFKMDENDGFDEWLWPDVAIFPSGYTAEQMRQTYALFMQKMTTELFRKKNSRTFGLIRASNAGASSYPYVIYNDYYSHRDFITALVNSSFIGVLWTPEVRSSKTAEEWLRRMQTVCFAPIAMINAWSDGTKPWSFPEVEKEVLDIANLRMKLIPYLYTTYADYAFKGIPPIRAMYLESGFSSSRNKSMILNSTDSNYISALNREMKDQFMVGEYLLVAPLFEGEKSRKVVLPKGKWYDFYTGKLAGEGEEITVTPAFDKIPVFVKDGGIIPMYQSSTKISLEKQPLEIRFYGEKENDYDLYDDDGISFDYEKGKYTRIKLEVSKTKNGEFKGKVNIPKNTEVWSFSYYSWKFMTK